MRSARNKHVTGGRGKKKHSDHQGAPVPCTMCSSHRRGGEGKSKCTTTADRASKKKKNPVWYHFNHIKIDLHARNRGGRDGSCHLVEWGVMNVQACRKAIPHLHPPIFNQDIAWFSTYFCLELEMLKTTGSPLIFSHAELTDWRPLLLAIITGTVQVTSPQNPASDCDNVICLI